MQSILTGCPLERIQIDILGPLPETNRANKLVAVVVDMYTKWPEVYALPDQEAEPVAQAVMDNFICHFSCPRGVLSDQGHNFELRAFSELCRGQQLPVSLPRLQKQWDQHLPKGPTGVASINPSNDGVFPSMLMFGRELRLPIDAMRKEPPSEQPPDYSSFVKKQREILKGVQEQVEKNLGANLHHQKDVFEARCKRRSRPYKKGDLVWLEEKAVSRWLYRKFYCPWSGPWRVVKAVLDVIYRIQCQVVAPLWKRRKTRLIVHFNCLKLYHARPAELRPTMYDVEEVANLPTECWRACCHGVTEAPQCRSPFHGPSDDGECHSCQS